MLDILFLYRTSYFQCFMFPSWVTSSFWWHTFSSSLLRKGVGRVNSLRPCISGHALDLSLHLNHSLHIKMWANKHVSFRILKSRLPVLLLRIPKHSHTWSFAYDLSLLENLPPVFQNFMIFLGTLHSFPLDGWPAPFTSRKSCPGAVKKFLKLLHWKSPFCFVFVLLSF